MLMLRKRFSSIGIKLFLSFWVITIISIVTTHLISEQFKNHGLIVPTHQPDATMLKRLKTRIANISPTDTSQVLSIATQRKSRILLLKNMQSSQTISSRGRHMASMIDFVSNNNLESMTTIKFDFFRMTGPVDITINQIPYQLYVSSHIRKDRFGNWIFDLPAWTKVVIPLFVSFILYWVIARSLTKPIIAMQNAAKKFGDGEFSARVPLSLQRKDEIGACAKSFNLMAEKLEQNIESHQRLMADVSHELRSPMARLQIAMGLAQQQNISPNLLNKHLQRCELEVGRLDEMISSVLSLSRMENTISQMELMSVDTTQLLSLCIEDAQYIANEKSVNIVFKSKKTTIINADPNLLASAFNNILTNAVKYSHQETQLNVDIKEANERIVIKVIDTGIGVPSDAINRLFEPFYRVEQARERITGGTGLGLAIAKQAITAHNGTIRAENNTDKGLTIIIELPTEIDKNAFNE